MNFSDAPESQFAASRERRGGLAGPPGGAQIRARAADAAGRAAHEVVRDQAPEAAKKKTCRQIGRQIKTIFVDVFY